MSEITFDRVVVTGGAGMIGVNLCASLLLNNIDVVIVDNFSRGKRSWIDEFVKQYDSRNTLKIVELDLENKGALDGIITSRDCVVHLADIVAGINFVFNNQGDVFRKNILINTYVIESCRKANIAAYLYVGTACSFPEEKQRSITATPLVEEDQYPANPESAYGWSKLMGEYEANLMSKECGIPVALLSLHNVFGAPCVYEEPTAQVIPATLRKSIRWPDEKLMVWGNGQQGRAFVHVDDVVKAILLSLQNGFNKGVIQIGPNNCTSISDIAEYAVNLRSSGIPIEYDLSKPVGDIGRCANYSKAQRVLGWFPSVSIKEGMNSLYHWILEDMRKNE